MSESVADKIRALWERVADRLAPTRVPVRVVVVDGEAAHSGLVYTTSRRVAAWFQDKTGVILQFDITEAQGIQFEPGLREAFNAGNYPVPTVFVFPQLPLFASVDNSLGVAYGEYLCIASNGMHLAATWKHEIAHWLGVRHEDGTFISEALALDSAPITKEQRRTIRSGAHLYRK
jgi:hypothetical protein